MTEFPYQLLINCTYPEQRTENVLCTALLRAIRGKREVYDALWNDKSVIVKVFSHKIHARRHLKREWQGLNLLQKRELNSPAPLFYGKTDKNQWAIIVEKITDSSTVLDVFQKTKDTSMKIDLLVRVCRELAKHHGKGVLQRDLHLGNFLMGDDKIVALDTAQMQFLPGDIGRNNSISQLALFLSCLPACMAQFSKKFCEEYFKARDWRLEKPDEASFQKQLAAQRKFAIRKWLKKCLRTNNKHLLIKTQTHNAMFERDFCRDAKPLNFIKQVDELMDKGQILKNGNSCYVSRLTWNNKDIVVKRFNHKGFIHSLRHTLKSSRAKRGWLHANRLIVLGIATPKPMAYIETLRNRLVWKSYLVTEYVVGQKLHDFLRDNEITEEQRTIATQQVKELLNKMGKHRITHGDLKHINILITDKEPVLIDLDGMKVHKFNWTHNLRQAKDFQRFEIG